MIRWFGQEHPASCVAACVRIALTAFDQQFEEIQIRRVLGNPRFGLTLSQAVDALTENGALAERHAGWNFDDLRDSVRAGNFPIVGVERRFFGHQSATHAVVLLAVKVDVVEFFDSLADERPQTSTRDTFESAWRSAGGEVLILHSSIPLI